MFVDDTPSQAGPRDPFALYLEAVDQADATKNTVLRSYRSARPTQRLELNLNRQTTGGSRLPVWGASSLTSPVQAAMLIPRTESAGAVATSFVEDAAARTISALLTSIAVL